MDKHPVIEEDDEQDISEHMPIPLVRATDRPHGPLINLVIFLLILIIAGGGIGGYFLLKLSEHVYTNSNVNVTVQYHGLDITFSTIQQADSFNDDSINSGGGAVRINLSIHNPATTIFPQALRYTDVLHLLSSGAVIVSPNNTLAATFQPKAGDTLTNWVDFSLPTNTDMSTYKILLGKSGEQPISVPIQKSTT